MRELKTVGDAVGEIEMIQHTIRSLNNMCATKSGEEQTTVMDAVGLLANYRELLKKQPVRV